MCQWKFDSDNREVIPWIARFNSSVMESTHPVHNGNLGAAFHDMMVC
jgi:hypothetical protein